ncbi:hypothetical protein BGY98DRAFT_231802 [Russula aff. rugulosa BPL654]|nr:hypothetical protein BGY98DRAFT_231802 [Russula aff. rugulosa BPL654]
MREWSETRLTRRRADQDITQLVHHHKQDAVLTLSPVVCRCGFQEHDVLHPRSRTRQRWQSCFERLQLPSTTRADIASPYRCIRICPQFSVSPVCRPRSASNERVRGLVLLCSCKYSALHERHHYHRHRPGHHHGHRHLKGRRPSLHVGGTHTASALSKEPSEDTLKECLKSMLTVQNRRPIFFGFDAIHKCPNSTGTPSPRENVLELIERLSELDCPYLSICITSRPEADIEAVLPPLASHTVSFMMRVDSRNTLSTI